MKMQEEQLEVLKIEFLDVESGRPPNGSHREEIMRHFARMSGPSLNLSRHHWR
jgi:hypothetical protein